MSKLFSKLHSSKVSAHPVPEDPLPPAAAPIPNRSHQALRHRPSKMVKSGPLEHHVERPSVNHTSVSSHPQHGSCNNYKPRTLWDARDTFLPSAKPPPPLPKLEKPKRTPSQHHVASHAGAAMSTPIYRQPWSTSSQSMSTEQSSYDLPVFDISRGHRVEVAPKMRGGRMRSNTQITASSGTSNESALWWKLPPSWVGTSADADKDSKPGAISLLRLGSRKRAQSNPRSNVRDAHSNKQKTLELF